MEGRGRKKKVEVEVGRGRERQWWAEVKVETDRDRRHRKGKETREGWYILLIAHGDGGRLGRSLTLVRNSAGSRVAVGERISGALGKPGRRGVGTVASMTHGLGGQIAFVHALGTILARRPAILVDTFGLALTAPDTAAGGSVEQRGAGGRPS